MRTNDFFASGEHAIRAYASPQVQIFTLRSEGVLCGSYYLGGGGVYGDDDMNDNGEY